MEIENGRLSSFEQCQGVALRGILDIVNWWHASSRWFSSPAAGYHALGTVKSPQYPRFSNVTKQYLGFLVNFNRGTCEPQRGSWEFFFQAWVRRDLNN